MVITQRNNAREVITDIILGVLATNRVGQWEDSDRGYPALSPHFHYKAVLCVPTSHLTQFSFSDVLLPFTPLLYIVTPPRKRNNIGNRNYTVK